MMRIKLVKTCSACPEQYYAFLGEQKVGYLRLLHGYFSVRFPDASGEEIYGSDTKGDGLFDSEERVAHLNAACLALMAAVTAVVTAATFKEEKLYDEE